MVPLQLALDVAPNDSQMGANVSVIRKLSRNTNVSKSLCSTGCQENIKLGKEPIGNTKNRVHAVNVLKVP